MMLKSLGDGFAFEELSLLVKCYELTALRQAGIGSKHCNFADATDIRDIISFDWR